MALSEVVRSRPRPTAEWPGLRTFRSARFRLAVAVTAWLLGSVHFGALLVRQAADPGGQFAFDFQIYTAAADRVAAGGSPYGPSMLEGQVPAQGVYEGIFKYPPMFAQLLVPLTALEFSVAATTWLVVQAGLILAGVWLAARAGGAPRTLEALCWSGAAATLFMPNFDTVWKGNVSGVLAFFVALALAGRAGAGLGVGAATLLKTTPVVMLPAVVAAGGRRLAGLILLAPVFGLSILLAPNAWFDFFRVLPNLVSGDPRFSTNLSPDNLAAFVVPSAPLVSEIVRWLAVCAGVAAVGMSMIVARRPNGWAAAVVLGVLAMLALPNVTWYHYLAILLPLAAYAWPRAGRGTRLGMAAGAGAISTGLVALPIATVGAGLMIGATLVAVWPRQSTQASTTR